MDERSSGATSLWIEGQAVGDAPPFVEEDGNVSSRERTAAKVGARHGRVVVLEIASGRMAGSGFIFYVSENAVWLTPHVPSRFIVFPDA